MAITYKRNCSDEERNILWKNLIQALYQNQAFELVLTAISLTAYKGRSITFISYNSYLLELNYVVLFTELLPSNKQFVDVHLKNLESILSKIALAPTFDHVYASIVCHSCPRIDKTMSILLSLFRNAYRQHNAISPARFQYMLSFCGHESGKKTNEKLNAISVIKTLETYSITISSGVLRNGPAGTIMDKLADCMVPPSFVIDWTKRFNLENHEFIVSYIRKLIELKTTPSHVQLRLDLLNQAFDLLTSTTETEVRTLLATMFKHVSSYDYDLIELILIRCGEITQDDSTIANVNQSKALLKFLRYVLNIVHLTCSLLFFVSLTFILSFQMRTSSSFDLRC